MKKVIGEGAFLGVVDEIRSSWGTGGTKRCVFSIFMKLGRVVK
jgi:hypothetical protein